MDVQGLRETRGRRAEVAEGILNLLPLLGAISLAIACALWAAASNAQARRAQSAMRTRVRELESALERSEAVLAADPGLVLVWGENDSQAPTLPVPIAELPRGPAPMTPSQIAGDFEALFGTIERTTAEQFRTLLARLSPASLQTFATALDELRGRGVPFSTVIERKDRGQLEVVGQTIGPRAVVRVRDVTAAVREVRRLTVLLEDTEAAARSLGEYLHALPVPLWRRDEGGRLNWVNAAYAELVQSSTPEVAVEKAVEIEASGPARARNALTAQKAIVERRAAKLSAGRRVFDFFETPLLQGSGGMAVDRTDAHELANAVQRNQAAQNRILDKLDLAVAIFQPDRTLQYANSAFARLWGLDQVWLESEPTHGEILERLREGRRLPEQRDFRTWKQERLALYGETVDGREDTWHLPDGRSIHMICRTHPLGGLIFIYEDVTARYALESEVNTLNEVQHRTLNNLEEGVAFFGTDGRLALHNQAFQSLWNLSAGQLEGRPHVNEVIAYCRDLFDEEDDWRAIRSRVTGGEDARTSDKRQIERNDGTILQFEVQPLRSGQTLVTFLDLTATVNMERALRDRNEALQAADKMKSDIIKNVSYQLRNPLTPIIGFSEMLESGIAGNLNDQQSGYVQNVIEGAHQLRELIDDILDLAMIEAGTLTLELGEVDVYEVLSGAAEGSVTTVDDSAVNITLNVDREIGTIEADNRRLRQVLFNLMSNALQHTGQGGRVELGARREGDTVHFWVVDDGQGLDAEAQMHAFDSFSSKDENGHRAGLGLALVKSFVQLHGGWVSLNSAPGEGTTVTCVVPVRADTSEVA